MQELRHVILLLQLKSCTAILQEQMLHVMCIAPGVLSICNALHPSTGSGHDCCAPHGLPGFFKTDCLRRRRQQYRTQRGEMRPNEGKLIQKIAVFLIHISKENSKWESHQNGNG